MAQALAEQLNMQVVTLGETKLPAELLAVVPETMAQLYRVIPIQFKDDMLTVATCDPQNLAIQDEMRTFLGFEIRMRRGHRARDSKGARQVLLGGQRESGERGQHAQRRRGAGRSGPVAGGRWPDRVGRAKVVDSARSASC